MVRWQDNNEVTAVTNFDCVGEPQGVKRWTKAKKKKDGTTEPGKCNVVQQPRLIATYNKGMGGVDQHDNGVQNYRINIRSKKWYWPLIVTSLDSAVVNSWKLHCFLSKYDKTKPMPQKDFKVAIAEALALTSDLEVGHEEPTDEENANDPEYQPVGLPRISGICLIVRQPQGKRRRCKLCGKKTLYMCKKCNVHLHSDCFEEFHCNNNK